MFDRPKLSEIVQDLEDDFAATVDGSYAKTPRSFFWILSRVFAGAIWLTYGFAEQVAKGLFPQTASGQALDRLGATYGVDRKGATKASGDLLVTGATGTVIPQGTTWSDGAGGRFTSTSAVTLTGPSGVVPVQAVEGGASGNLDAGADVVIESPIAGLDTSATANAAFTGGTDAQDDATYRQAILDRMRATPAGGSKSDYERWAKATPDVNVAKAWVETAAVAQVDVSFRLIRAAGDLGETSTIPSSSDLLAVANYIKQFAPLGIWLKTPANTPATQDITVQVPDVGIDVNEVKARLLELFDTLGPGDVLFESDIYKALSKVDGMTWANLTTPAGNVAFASGSWPTLGTLTVTT